MRWFSIAVSAKFILVSVLASKSWRSPLDSLSCTPYTSAALVLKAAATGGLAMSGQDSFYRSFYVYH